MGFKQSLDPRLQNVDFKMGVTYINPYRFPPPGGGGGAAFTDDFTTDPSSRWNTVTTPTFTWNSGAGDVDMESTSQMIYTADTCDTISQYCYCKIDFTGSAQSFSAIVLRANNDTGNAYAIRNDNGSIRGRTINGASGVGDIFDWARTLTSGDYIGATVTGTGASTEFVIYDFGATDPGGGPDSVDWGAAADATLTVNSGTWIANSQPADTGLHTGLYNGSSGTPQHDDFNGGDFTP